MDVTAYALSLTLIRIVMDVDALSDLKKKVSEEFFQLMCRVRRGYKPNYEFILEEISFIDLIKNREIDDKLSLTALQYYLNNKWQIIQS